MKLQKVKIACNVPYIPSTFTDTHTHSHSHRSRRTHKHTHQQIYFSSHSSRQTSSLILARFCVDWNAPSPPTPARQCLISLLCEAAHRDAGQSRGEIEREWSEWCNVNEITCDERDSDYKMAVWHIYACKKSVKIHLVGCVCVRMGQEFFITFLRDLLSFWCRRSDEMAKRKNATL